MHELNSVRKGITCVLCSLLATIGGFAFLFLGAFIASTLPTVALLLLWLAPVLLIGGVVLGLSGRVLCLRLPNELNSRGIIITVIVCEVLVLSAALVGRFITLPAALTIANLFLSLVAAILFLVFLKRIATYVRDGISAKRAGSVLKLGAAAFILTIAGLFLRPLLFLALPMFALSVFCYGRLLFSLRSSLSRSAGRIAKVSQQQFAEMGLSLVNNYRRRGIKAGFGRGCSISDDDLAALAPLRIQELYLSRTQLTDQSLPHLEAMDRLTVLDLSHTKISRGGINRLREVLPQTTVIG